MKIEYLQDYEKGEIVTYAIKALNKYALIPQSHYTSAVNDVAKMLKEYLKDILLNMSAIHGNIQHYIEEAVKSTSIDSEGFVFVCNAYRALKIIQKQEERDVRIDEMLEKDEKK
jgi:hypothetical protein